MLLCICSKKGKKKNPATSNTTETHTNHNPEVLWDCGRNRRQCVKGTRRSLTDGRITGRLLRPAMTLVRLTHCRVHDKSHIITSLSAGSLKHSVQHCCVEKWLQACGRVSLVWGNDAWCHRWKTRVSSGMHGKSPDDFLKNLFFSSFYDVSQKSRKKGVGRQCRRTSARVQGGQLSEGERQLKLRPLSANHSILINSIPYLQVHSLVLNLTVFCSQCHCLYR